MLRTASLSSWPEHPAFHVAVDVAAAGKLDVADRLRVLRPIRVSISADRFRVLTPKHCISSTLDCPVERLTDHALRVAFRADFHDYPVGHEALRQQDVLFEVLEIPERET
jgi:hypothetical protein